MRLIKLMLAASVAVCAFASCNKQETTPISKRLKTVEVSLENVVISKAVAEDKINSGDAVVVNDLKIFLTDAAGNEYTAKKENGVDDAQSYFEGLPGKVAEFHYVDPNCTKVVAVANLGEDITFAEYKAGLEDLDIDVQQDPKALVLYDDATLVGPDGEHNDANSDGTTYLSPVYKAELTLTPRVSRFEVDGFVVNFNDEPKYEEINITQLAFTNYYQKTTVVEGTESELVNHIADFANQAEVYAWLDNEGTGWYRDSFDITITPADNKADTPDPLAYHIFSCDKTPVMVIKLYADGQPAYLYSKGFYTKDAEEVTEFEEGKIYRMSAAGDVLGDGSIPVDEDDIDPMDRCLEITVEVIKWAVELVYPEF